MKGAVRALLEYRVSIFLLSLNSPFDEMPYLCKRHPLPPFQKHAIPLALTPQQRLNLPLQIPHHHLLNLRPFLLSLRSQRIKYLRVHLGEKGIDEEGDLGSQEGRGRGGVRGGEEVRGEGVGEELGDDGGFGEGGCDESVGVGDGRDETALKRKSVEVYGEHGGQG